MNTKPETASEPSRPHPPAVDDARPAPPSRRWLKRLAWLVPVLLPLLLLMIGWGWNRAAERRLQAKIAEYRAAGQPVLMEDFAVPPVPDAENAAHFLQLAADLFTKPAEVTDDCDQLLLLSNPDTRAADLEQTWRLIEANQETLRLITQARSKAAADWKIPLTSPVIDSLLLDHLSPQRTLAKLTCLTARHQHHSGDDAAAVEMLRDALALGRHLDGPPTSLISHLLRIGVEAVVTRTVEAVSFELQVADAVAPSAEAARPANRAQVRALIGDLLHEDQFREAWRFALYSERMMQLDTIQGLLDGRFSSLSTAVGNPTGEPPSWARRHLVRFFLAPVWKLDAIRTMEYTTAIAHAGTARNWPTAAEQLPTSLSAPRSRTWVIFRLFSEMLTPSLERACVLHFRALLERRLAATALAIRLYEVDHGRRPARLADLVPEYLPAVPRDPFAADDREIGYRPDAPQPILYSVSRDGVDDGGAFALTPRGSVDLNQKDYPFFLNGDRPQRRPSALQSDSAPATQPAFLTTAPSTPAVPDAPQAPTAQPDHPER